VLTLRPYQQIGLEEIRGCLGQSAKAPLFVLPTGGGKTVTYAAMALGASRKGNNILILEHRKELVKQASCAIARLGLRHRIVAPPDKIAMVRREHVKLTGWPMVDDSSNVAVASVQTLARRMDWLKQFNPRIIIIDEAHHAVAGTWAKIIKACPHAVLVGVTATPCRTDGQGLGDVFDRLILGPSMGELIDDGYLVPYRIIVPPRLVDLSKVRHKGGDLDSDAQAALLDKPHITGDAVKHYGEIAPGEPAIVFCTNVKHAEHVAEAFRASGWRFEVVIGDMDEDLRDKRINGLADGSLQGIVTVDIAGEGTDIPVATVGIMLRLTDSYGLFKQQAGRISRPIYASGFDLACREGRLDAIAASSKPFGILIDHVGNVGVMTQKGFIEKHGSPVDEPIWSLKGRIKQKRAANDNEPKVSITQCPICFGVAAPRTVCGLPKPGGGTCDHVFASGTSMPEQRDGQLIELTPEVVAQQAARKAQGSARTLAQLKAMGMSDQRAAHILAAREEKDRLRGELTGLIKQAIAAGIVHGIKDVYDLKPAALRDQIERLRSELGHVEFMGAAEA
jgi:DNA repair protein RadD